MKNLNEELINAACRSDAARVVALLVEGADVHTSNEKALHWAVYRGHIECVKALLTAGADVHAFNDLALRWAATTCHAECIRELCRNDVFNERTIVGIVRELIHQRKFEMIPALLSSCSSASSK